MSLRQSRGNFLLAQQLDTEVFIFELRLYIPSQASSHASHISEDFFIGMRQRSLVSSNLIKWLFFLDVVGYFIKHFSTFW